MRRMACWEFAALLALGLNQPRLAAAVQTAGPGASVPPPPGVEPGTELSDGGQEAARAANCALGVVVEEMDELGFRWPEQNCSSPSLQRARQEPVIWIHLHKTAGSTMCALARQNGERVVQPHMNCNWYPYDDIGGEGQSCDKRASFFRSTGASWGAIERVVEDADFCPGFRYATLLREPTSLALSAIKYHHFTKEDFRRGVSCVRLGDCNDTVVGADPSFQFKLWWYLDNFVVRTLAGKGALQAPPGKVSKEHVDKAMKVLKRMDSVLLLEELMQGGLSRAFDWNAFPESALHKKHIAGQANLPAADVQVLRGMNKHDYSLYSYVKSMKMPDRVRPAPASQPGGQQPPSAGAGGSGGGQAAAAEKDFWEDDDP